MVAALSLTEWHDRHDAWVRAHGDDERPEAVRLADLAYGVAAYEFSPGARWLVADPSDIRLLPDTPWPVNHVQVMTTAYGLHGSGLEAQLHG